MIEMTVAGVEIHAVLHNQSASSAKPNPRSSARKAISFKLRRSSRAFLRSSWSSRGGTRLIVY